jgi:hypothetical protein
MRRADCVVCGAAQWYHAATPRATASLPTSAQRSSAGAARVRRLPVQIAGAPAAGGIEAVLRFQVSAHLAEGFPVPTETSRRPPAATAATQPCQAS